MVGRGGIGQPASLFTSTGDQGYGLAVEFKSDAGLILEFAGLISDRRCRRRLKRLLIGVGDTYKNYWILIGNHKKNLHSEYYIINFHYESTLQRRNALGRSSRIKTGVRDELSNRSSATF